MQPAGQQTDQPTSQPATLPNPFTHTRHRLTHLDRGGLSVLAALDILRERGGQVNVFERGDAIRGILPTDLQAVSGRRGRQPWQASGQEAPYGSQATAQLAHCKPCAVRTAPSRPHWRAQARNMRATCTMQPAQRGASSAHLHGDVLVSIEVDSRVVGLEHGVGLQLLALAAGQERAGTGRAGSRREER